MHMRLAHNEKYKMREKERRCDGNGPAEGELEYVCVEANRYQNSRFLLFYYFMWDYERRMIRLRAFLKRNVYKLLSKENISGLAGRILY